ncbi:DUF4393 domain-containing protein [Thermoleophilia bacterium SCSIO 60948]|nr:DUF4393 domain-containing protein [Thermoleophilia bacterium SCSIO 60948]
MGTHESDPSAPNVPGSQNGARRDEGVAAQAPGLARLAFDVYVNTATWAVSTGARASSRVLRAVARGENPALLAGEAADELRGGARRLLGIEPPPNTAPPPGAAEQDVPEDDEHAELKLRGAELLRRSADVHDPEQTDLSHPAYERILEDIAPDEARILRLLATRGPQPAVDVRTWRPLGVGSTLVAAGLSMIGAESGMRRPERIHANLDNLARLGLIWFPHEPLPDPRVYQVVEAQPEVIEALERAGHGRTERRAISLTSFGAAFCDAALPLDHPDGGDPGANGGSRRVVEPAEGSEQQSRGDRAAGSGARTAGEDSGRSGLAGDPATG